MAGFIPPDKLEQIRSANDIVDIIGAVLPLKRAGANFTALCPFHKEKSPSFNVNPHKQIFHCFGCHKGGDVFTFIREYENLSFPEAIKRLADRANILLEFDNQPGQQQTRHLKDTLLEIHEGIAQRWQNALANDASGQIARDYLAKRGVSDEAVKLFRLGYAPDAWDDTVNWAKNKGYDLSLVEQGGLVVRKEETGRYYDRFRGRLMFPICDEQGRVIAFSGRILSGDEKTAKYVNSPETPLFIKSKVFFGLDKSKRAILDAGFVIICEGQLDLIASYMAGVKNIVAPQGTAFTPDHARILKRYVEEVVLCFDSDSAGQNAAVRVFDSLLASGVAVRVAIIPAPHDPDSFIKEHGGEAFQQLINKAEGFFDFYLHRLCATNDVKTDKGRLAVANEMSRALNKTGSAVLLDAYAQKTAQRLGVAADAMRTEFKRGHGFGGVIAADTENQGPEPEIPLPSQQEMWLIRILLQDDEHVGWVAAHLNPEWLSSSLAQKIVLGRIASHQHKTWKSLPAFLDECEDPLVRRIITEAALDSRKIPEPEKVLKGDPLKHDGRGILQRWRDDFIDRQLVSLQRRLEQPGVDLRQIENQRIELRELKKQPLQQFSN
jgi:DNA primase